MLATAPLAIDVLFVVTVIGTLALVLGGASRAAARVSPGALRGVRVAAVAAGGWLALTAALAALRPLTTGRLVVVIGAGGDRDPGKRPMMGEVAARLADVLVVTDDNPRSEDPAAIRSQLRAGAHSVPPTDRAELHEVGDRRSAIRLAVSLARPGDTAVVAGKGHETGQEVGGRTQPFDDRAVLREELAAR